MNKNNLLITKSKNHFLIEFDETDKMASVELFEEVPGFEIIKNGNGSFRVPLRYKPELIKWANDNFKSAEIVENINGEDVIKDFLTDKPKAKQCGLGLKMS